MCLADYACANRKGYIVFLAFYTASYFAFKKTLYIAGLGLKVAYGRYFAGLFDQLNYVINEESTNTSGGEKQKISILKVLCKDPPVMIFDEPTSALDAEATGRFVKYLQGIKCDRIIVIITHDEAVKKSCDFVVNLTTTVKS